MKDARKILTRHAANPLIKIEDYPGVMQIFNPSPVMYEDKTILLVSIRYFKGGAQTRVATSDDGIHFTIGDHPFINLDTETYPYDIVQGWIIDSRITKIDDTYYILTPICCGQGFESPVGVLGKTKDFEKYEVVEVITQPRNRGASLFPEKINGKYYKLDRPGAGDGQIGCGIWVSSSPDLIHWGCFRPLLSAGYVGWGSSKIGPTPPIKTDKGWLVLVHGVTTPCDGPHYRIGAILLDYNDPCKVIGKTYSYLLSPEEEYEKNGAVDNVVFPCGAIADDEKDELRLYYGAADTSICLASGSLSEVVDACLREL